MLTAALELLGFRMDKDFDVVDRSDGNGPALVAWKSAAQQPAPEAIGAAMLVVARTLAIAAINAECRSRLLARYGPAEEQVSRAVGVYGAQEQSGMQAGIAATIDASNTASNAVLAAADIAAVGAVGVSWPNI